LNAYNVDSIAFNGQRIVQVGAPPAASFGLASAGQGCLVVQICELQNPQFTSYTSNLTKIVNAWIYGERCRANEMIVFSGVLFDAIDALQGFLNMRFMHIARTAFVGGGTLEWLSQAPNSTRTPDISVARLENVIFRDILGATGDGFRLNGGRCQMDNVLINGCGRDGIRCEEDVGFLVLNNVRCTVPNGVTVATGVGLNIQSGMKAKVNAATSAPADVLRGVGGEMKVGAGAVRTWADFLSGASGMPIRDELDYFLVAGAGGTFSNFAALASYIAGSGSRIFQTLP
jgi:hypothetical protein